jgi:hypothetical protein
MLPGGSYSLDAPAFYFITDFFLERGCDILQVRADNFRDEEFMRLWRDKKTQECEEHRLADARKIAAYIKAAEKGPLTFVGFSAGTFYLAEIRKEVTGDQTIWMSAGLRDRWPELGRLPNDIAIYGEADPLYEQAKPYLPVRTLALPRTGHDLTIDHVGEILTSIENLKEIIKFLTPIVQI